MILGEFQYWWSHDYQLNKGTSINRTDSFLDVFDRPLPLWNISLNKTYVVIWTFGKPSPPHMVYEWSLMYVDDDDSVIST